MSAIYRMNYSGRNGGAGGVIYLGHSAIAGADQAGTVYEGSYVEENGRMRVSLNLTVPAGTKLASGKEVHQATVMPMTGEFPLNFANGQKLTMFIWGNPVNVAFEKIRDLP
ncbi:MAG: hypothetical protein H7Y08_00765 [Rhizobiaceae bacterium]|nr:hypothetical protein [Rhizobiaceae bacterium]